MIIIIIIDLHHSLHPSLVHVFVAGPDSCYWYHTNHIRKKVSTLIGWLMLEKLKRVWKKNRKNTSKNTTHHGWWRCLVLFCVVTSCLVFFSCLVWRCLVFLVSCLVLPYPALSCLVLFCLVLSCLVLCVVCSCFVVLSCLVLFCLVSCLVSCFLSSRIFCVDLRVFPCLVSCCIGVTFFLTSRCPPFQEVGRFHAQRSRRSPVLSLALFLVCYLLCCITFHLVL